MGIGGRPTLNASRSPSGCATPWPRAGSPPGELEERLGAVYSATTHDQLEPLTNDLPAWTASGSPSWRTDVPAATGPPGPGSERDAPMSQRRPTNTMAILSLVFAFVFFPLGTVFGVIARRQITRTGEEGRGLASSASSSPWRTSCCSLRWG